MDNNTAWGGQRDGSGRKRLSEDEPTVIVTARVPESYTETLRQIGDGNMAEGIRRSVERFNHQNTLIDESTGQPHILSGVYFIRSKSTGKIYVGSSINICQRFIAHIIDLKKKKHTNKQLQGIVEQHGLADLIFEIQEIVDDETLVGYKEQEWLDTIMPEARMNSHEAVAKFNSMRPAVS